MEEEHHAKRTFAVVSIVARFAGAVVVSRAGVLAGLAAFLLTGNWTNENLEVRTKIKMKK